ncbi:MAG: hypothetical protein HRU15_19970, partial [Planctomycetes bacterium]|nr:hypothetical protein [Planctomycetota bacterium]
VEARYQKDIIARAINIGSIEAGLMMIECALWNAAADVNPLKPPLLDWKESADDYAGVPIKVIYAEILANWATRQEWLSRDEQHEYMKEAAFLMKGHAEVHPIVSAEFLWLWKYAEMPGDNKSPAFNKLRDAAIVALKKLVEEKDGAGKIAAILTLCELYEIRKDYAATRPYYEEAIAMGSAKAQHSAGMHLIEGHWKPQDAATGKQLVVAASAQGHKTALHEVRQRGFHDGKLNRTSVHIFTDERASTGNRHVQYNLYATNGSYHMAYVAPGISRKFQLSKDEFVLYHKIVNKILQTNALTKEVAIANTLGLTIMSGNNPPRNTRIKMSAMPQSMAAVFAKTDELLKMIPKYPVVKDGVGESMTFVCDWSSKGDQPYRGGLRRNEYGIWICARRDQSRTYSKKKMSMPDMEKLYAAVKRISLLPSDDAAAMTSPSFSLSVEWAQEQRHRISFSCSLKDPQAIPVEVLEFFRVADELGAKYK